MFFVGGGRVKSRTNTQMHGRKTEKREEHDAEEVKLARKQKYKQYLQACKLALQSEEAAQQSEKLLRYNPDFSTLWNARRRGILKQLALIDNNGDSVDAARLEVLERELELTQQQISERNSKSYGAWYHRIWIVNTIVSAQADGKLLVDFTKEFALCDSLLERDERNFHCWHYRNFLIEKQQQDSETFHHQVVEKSRQLIERNFSNYSAWHLRVQGLKRDLDKVDWDLELELTHQAMFTEPADQSAWLYYRWAIKRASLSEQRLEEESETILMLLEDEGKDCKWPLLALVQLQALLPQNSVNAVLLANEYCSRLSNVDPLHTNFYQHLAKLFQAAEREKLHHVLFS